MLLNLVTIVYNKLYCEYGRNKLKKLVLSALTYFACFQVQEGFCLFDVKYRNVLRRLKRSQPKVLMLGHSGAIMVYELIAYQLG